MTGPILGALQAEWTKLRTTRGPAALLLVTVLLTIALGAAVAGGVHCPATGCRQDAVKLSLTGVLVGQAVVAVLAVLTISGEYSTGLIATTVTAIPQRWLVLATKVWVLTAVVLIAGVFSALGSVLVGRILLSGNGFSTANGYPPLSLTDGPTFRAVVGSALYLVLVAWLALGIATAVRDSAVAIGGVLGLLYLFPILTMAVTDPEWHRRLQKFAPMTAGLAIQSTRDLGALVIGPWAGLGVLAAWAVAALLGGAVLLRLRDA